MGHISLPSMGHLYIRILDWPNCLHINFFLFQLSDYRCEDFIK